jgi:uncharacterized 2Fe-2S/4Fe-4S cluster protein (DUF4445 family)
MPNNNFQVIYMPSGRRGKIEEGESLLEAARQLGVEIESICGGRLTCGKCKVRVEEGTFQKHGITSQKSHVSPPGKVEADLLKEIDAQGYRLACQTFVQGDCLLYIPEEARGQKQIIRKSATERVIEIAPTIQQLFVQVEEAEMGVHLGDWGRLQAALAEQWGLGNLKIDLDALRKLQPALRQENWGVTVIVWNKQEVIDVAPGYVEGIYGFAVDVGSTTVAGYLCDLRTGEVLATASMMNPQVTYGEDLMSRVSYAMSNKNGLSRMHKAIIDAINKLAADAARQAGLRVRYIHEIVLVGNTSMIHILLGINPAELGQAPFALANRDALDIKARDLGLRLHFAANAHILPSEAGHVGADNVGALLAEEPYRHEDTTLLVDIGTNAEIVLGNRNWMYSASSPTGPAFEGAQITFGMRAAPGAIERVRIDPNTLKARFRVIGEESWSDTWLTQSETGDIVPLEKQPNHLAAGICGSGIIEVIAEMFLCGIIQPDGRFTPNLNNKRIIWNGRVGSYILATGEQTATGEPITVTQDDVRNIQLAKSALYAGAKLLMTHAKIKAVDRIILAGAFGSYIDTKYAMILGLIPDCDLKNVYAVGNAAGDGARIALLNKNKRLEAQVIARKVRYIETAMHPAFQEAFVDALHLPHKTDPYPHLEGRLPQKMGTPPEDRRQRRRRRGARSE